jgi:hypothetical protein
MFAIVLAIAGGFKSEGHANNFVKKGRAAAKFSKLRRNGSEGLCQAGSDLLHRADGGNRNQRCDQPVFDRGRPTLVIP